MSDIDEQYLEAIAIAQEKDYYPYVLLGNMLYKVNEKKDKDSEEGGMSLIPIASRIEIERDRINIDTNVVELALRYYYKGEFRHLPASRDVLNKRNFSGLMKYGVDIGDNNVDDICNFLLKQEQSAPAQYVHNSLGWGKYRDIKIFKLYKALGIDSTYVGGYDLQPKGSFEEWNECVKNEVIGNTPMELALAIGFSAPVVAMLRDKVTKDSLLVHLAGDSSKGKTTAEMLAVSPFGSPDDTNGLLKSWQMTPNALIGSLDNMFGVPLVLDEASIKTRCDFTSLVYQIVQGRNKDRMKSDASLRPPTSWCTTVLSSGEISLKNHCMQNTGIRVRLIEISGVVFTKSAEHSDRIRNCVLHNYGHAGIIFVQYLMEAGTSKIYDTYNQCRELLMKNVSSPDSFTSRYVGKLAIILTAAACMQEAFHYKLDLHGIAEILLKNDNDSAEERNIGVRAFEDFKEWFSANIEHFAKGKCSPRSTNIWGKYSEKPDCTEVVVLPHFLGKMLAERGYADEKVVCDNWKSAGILVTEPGHNKIKRTISSKFVETRCYVLRVPKAESAELEEEEPPVSDFEAQLAAQKPSAPAEDISKMF